MVIDLVDLERKPLADQIDFYLTQECIPVECVPSAAVAAWGGGDGVCPEGYLRGEGLQRGVCMGGCLHGVVCMGVSAWGVPAWDGVCMGGVYIGGCLYEGCLHGGCLHGGCLHGGRSAW